MPWKNGGGFTDEIAIDPPEAQFPQAPFAWRLSSAHVATSGPFSQFPGYQRLISWLSGGELELLFVARREVLKKGTVLQFAGEESVIGSLLSDSPVQDVNLIYDPRKVTVDFRYIELAETGLTLNAKGANSFIIGVEGDSIASSCTVQYTGPQKISLPGSDIPSSLLWIDICSL